jgi:hypothetical protein
LDVSGNQTYDEYGNPVFSPPVDVESRAIRISPVRGEEISVGEQTHIVDYRGAWPPAPLAEVPEPTDEITFSLSGYRPVRCRVLAVFAVPCPRRAAVKFIRADLEAVE